MKCALSGMYGRVIPVESNTMTDILKSDYESVEDFLKEAQDTYKDPMSDLEKLQKEINEMPDSKDKSTYNQIVEWLRQKDMEEHR